MPSTRENRSVLNAVKPDRAVRILFTVLFAAISIWHTARYIHFEGIIRNEPPIEYAFLDKMIRNRARGDYYQMAVMFERKRFTVDITSKTYKALDQSVFPELYYSRDYGLVFSAWEKLLTLRIAVLFFTLTVAITVYDYLRFARRTRPS